MKKFCVLFVSVFLVSCGWVQDSDGDITAESVMSTYKKQDRSLNMADADISGFVSLNGLNGDTEIVNIYLQNNSIEVLNISEYEDLGRLNISNNGINFFGDIKYPSSIRHLDLSYNNLESLEGIQALTELKTLNVAHNKLTEEDFKVLWGLKKLQFIWVAGNDISPEFENNMNTFNAAYLGRIKR